MTKKNTIQYISDNYSRLSDDSKTALLNHSTVLNLNKNSILVKEGQYSDKMFFIIKGTARAFYLKDGKDISDWFAFENEFICSINSYFQNIPSPHFIELLEDSTLLEISRNNFIFLMDRSKEFEKLGRIAVTKTMLQLQQRIIALQFETARQKYENLLDSNPSFTQKVSLTHIASYLGITLETLSRIRNKK